MRHKHDYPSKSRLLADMQWEIPSSLDQARRALEVRNCELSAWAQAEIMDGGFKWVVDGELCECQIVHQKGDEDFEQNIGVQMFTDTIPQEIDANGWLDAAGVLYIQKGILPNGRRGYKPIIITQSPRAMDPPAESRFNIMGDFYGWRRREAITDEDLDRPWITGSANIFSKGRSVGQAYGPHGRLEEVFERVAARITGHKDVCGDKDLPSLIQNTDAGDVVYVAAAGRVFCNTGDLLLRHPSVYRNPKALARIERRRQSVYDETAAALYGGGRALARAS